MSTCRLGYAKVFNMIKWALTFGSMSSYVNYVNFANHWPKNQEKKKR